ncbi:hypothetical protein TWF594_007734 [Orbilia oligospora]|nr:hypothetical protein TWF594_007734 [Orbilia oligospora]
MSSRDIGLSAKGNKYPTSEHSSRPQSSSANPKMPKISNSYWIGTSLVKALSVLGVADFSELKLFFMVAPRSSTLAITAPIGQLDCRYCLEKYV